MIKYIFDWAISIHVAYICNINIVMDIESIREYCLSLPMASEDMGLGEEYLLFRVFGKIFACYGFVRDDYFVLKSSQDYAQDLRDRYEDIRPAWHWNKKYWNQVSLRGCLSDEFIRSLIRNSYAEVVKKLPKRVINEFPQILEYI